MEKQAVRQAMLQQRRSLTKQEITAGSSRVVSSLLAWQNYRRAKSIMAYLAMSDEPDVDEILRRALADDKQVYIPFITDVPGIIKPARLRSMNEIVTGRFNIRSVAKNASEFVCPEDIDMILVPGVAYDVAGCRLGMGGGYYDRFLPQAMHAVTVGVCWQFNVRCSVPREAFDVCVDYILTEQALCKCKKGKM